MKSIAAIVITHNESAKIEDCLRSLEFCDERWVVDSFSTDDTVDRAAPLADRIVRREFRDHAEQKNWAMDQVDCEWILILDADERIPKPLAQELRDLAEAGEYDAAWIRRRNAFFGRWIEGAGWKRDRVLRFLRRGVGTYAQAKIHEEIVCEPSAKVTVCKEPMVHFSYDDWDRTFERLLRYSSWGAAERARRRREFSVGRVVRAPLARFFRQYILQAGFRDGMHGYVLCTWSAIGVFLRELKGQLGETARPVDARALEAPPRVEWVLPSEMRQELPPTESSP